MGFSVSGSAVVLFAGLLVAFGMWSTATAQHEERISESERARSEQLLKLQNTAINITDARWPGTAVNFDLENTGARSIRKSKLSVVVDGTYEDFDVRDGDLIRPGEEITIGIPDIETQPTRLKVVTGLGVGDTSEVRSTI